MRRDVAGLVRSIGHVASGIVVGRVGVGPPWDHSIQHT
jgi:hypothetical protein